MNWEELNDLAIPQLPEAYTIQESHPVPYADTINEDSILPSLPQLGILDYQNIPEDILSFCDTLSSALTARSIPESSFAKQKPFLPYFGRFIIERLPVLSHTFYGRPVFTQDGSAEILFRLSVKPQETKNNAPQLAEIPAAAESAGEARNGAYKEKPREQKSANLESAGGSNEHGSTPELLSPADTAARSGSFSSEQAIKVPQRHESEISALFSGPDTPDVIMLKLTAIKEDGSWKVAGIEVKGAEYADSALKN